MLLWGGIMSHMWEEALCCVCTACVLFENRGETCMSGGEGCPCCVRREGSVQQHRGAEQACGPSPAPGQAPSLRKRPWQATRSILARGLGQRATFLQARALLPGPASRAPPRAVATAPQRPHSLPTSERSPEQDAPAPVLCTRHTHSPQRGEASGAAPADGACPAPSSTFAGRRS